MRKLENELNLNLLENGLDFILSAIRYLSSSEEKTNLKYAILHLSAGVDLILKYRLSLEHWSLLFQKIDNANQEDFQKGNFKSVESRECLDRLSNICGINLSEETKRNLLHLRDKRNKIEHFGISESVFALKSSTMKVLNVIITFINEEFDSEELELHQDIIREIRVGFRDFSEFIDSRMALIKDKLNEHMKSSSVTYCPSCHQKSLCLGEDEIICLFCGHSSNNQDEIVEDFIWEILGESEYECVTQGGEYPLFDCIECGNHTLVHLSPYLDDDGWICFSCGYNWRIDEINFCGRCGQTFRSKHGSEICSDCIEQILNHDD